MAVWCDQNFTAEDGKTFLASSGDSLTGEFVSKVSGTVVAGVGTFASYSLPKTDLATPGANVVRYYARIFNSHGAPTDYFPFSDRYLRSSLGSSISELQWALDNAQRASRQPDTNPTTNQMNAAIQAALYAPMTTTQLGLGEVSVNPVDAASPILVGDNDPRVFQLDGATGLTTSKAIVTIGDLSATAASRFVLRTQSAQVYALNIQTSNFTNGPVGVENYKDHVMQLGYNSAANGNKITAGKVNFSLAFESDWYPSPVEANKQTEIYWSYELANGLTTFRPWGFDVKQQSGDVTFNQFGTQVFRRNIGNGGGVFAVWGEDGLLDFNQGASSVSAGIALPNNSPKLTWWNAANTNGIPAIYLDASDQFQLAPGGQKLIIGSQEVQVGDVNGTIQVGFIVSRSESDTYISLPGSNIIRFATNGSVKARFDSDGFAMQSALIFDTDGIADIGKIAGTPFRPNDVFVKRNVDIDGVFMKGGTQVVGARVTGWTVATGTPSRGTFATSTVTTEELAKRVMAMEQDLIAHGIIGA